MIRRNLAKSILAALRDTPVVLLVGPRQSGKTTLARSLVGRAFPARYLSLDDPALMAAARSDPAAFLSDLEGPAILDEVQLAPALASPLRSLVDRDRKPGRFLLTGSADVLLAPRFAQTLVGRMEVFHLWPFSQGEIEGRIESFLDGLFRKDLPKSSHPGEEKARILTRALKGGFPEPLTRSKSRASDWFRSYLAMILQREIRDLARIEGLDEIPRLLEILAARATGILNFSEVSRTAGIPQTTLKRYMALLEHTFLIRRIPAWTRNLTKRPVKSPKLLFSDTGLLSHLAGWNLARMKQHPDSSGPLLENFAAMEVMKQTGWARTRARIFHFRLSSGREVDLVLEDQEGRVVGIEIKAKAAIDASAFQGLRALEEAAGKAFHRGIVLYTGKERIAFGKNLHALPFPALWQ